MAMNLLDIGDVAVNLLDKTYEAMGHSDSYRSRPRHRAAANWSARPPITGKREELRRISQIASGSLRVANGLWINSRGI